MVQHNIDIALDLVQSCPSLVVARDRKGDSPFTLHSCFSLTCFSIMQIMDEFNYINVNYVMISLYQINK